MSVAGSVGLQANHYAYASTLPWNTPVALTASHRGVRTTPMVHAALHPASAIADRDDAPRPDRRRESSGAGRRHHLQRWGLAPRANDPVAWSGGALGSGALVRSALVGAHAVASHFVAMRHGAVRSPGFRSGRQRTSTSGSAQRCLPRGAVSASLAGWRLPAVSVVPPSKAGEACPLIARRSRTAMEGTGAGMGRSSTC